MILDARSAAMYEKNEVEKSLNLGNKKLETRQVLYCQAPPKIQLILADSALFSLLDCSFFFALRLPGRLT